MKAVLSAVAAMLIGGMVASYAKLPPTPPKSDADKAAEAQKADAAKAKDAANLAKAQDKAVANYKSKKGAASMDRKK